MSALRPTTAVLEQALKYAQYGWPVFPCRPGGKQPITQHGLHDATTDPQRVTRIFTNWPNANIGIRTGADARLVVLDVDGTEGYESLRELEHQHQPLPTTLSIKTPRGGQHFYFQHPRNGDIRNSAGQLGTGLDIRGDGGYVVAPPSTGRNGGRYTPDEIAPPQPLPAWLHSLIKTQPVGKERTATPAFTWIAMLRDGIGDGTRNTSLARLVGHLLRRDVDPEVVKELAHVVNTARCRPPLPADEVDRLIESIVKAELRRIGVPA